MANRARPTRLKREKEKARIEKRKEKDARRVEAKERRAHAPRRDDNYDPDIAGIVPGPQAPVDPLLAEFLREEAEEGETETED
jgi:hypothetical protein